VDVPRNIHGAAAPAQEQVRPVGLSGPLVHEEAHLQCFHVVQSILERVYTAGLNDCLGNWFHRSITGLRRSNVADLIMAPDCGNLC